MAVSKLVTFSFMPVAPVQDGALVVLVDDKAMVASGILNSVNEAQLKKLISVRGFSGKLLETAETMADTLDRLILLGVGDPTKLDADDWLKLGGMACKAVTKGDVSIAMALAKGTVTYENIADFAAGFRLGAYRFNKYKTKLQDDDKKEKSLKVNFLVDDVKLAQKALNSAMAVADGVELARTLVNEPANHLGTEEFIEKVKKLEKLGLGIEILSEKEMKKLGFSALLAVAQGSNRPPYLAIMSWNGGNSKQKPLAFVGKGVVFDSGGISLKPGAGMEDMKGDMGGAAAVTGLMKTLALRKAKVNAVGVIGIVENMPDSKAQRPGDVVTSLSGQTIEVINTDAEGRLVLADALWYTKEKYKPELMVNLATLTGAIMVALGTQYAGLFSNHDTLASHLAEAGRKTGEKLWRMPLDSEYDKIVDSKIADMRNSCGRNAGAITAAQFLQRFVGNANWAHLDIAGTAMGAPENEYTPSWGSGFGVRLLNRFIKDYYEA